MEKEKQNKQFLQSAQWLKFQESVGRKTFHLKDGMFSASIVEHALPVAGKYLYAPRGPIVPTAVDELPISNDQMKYGMQKLVELAKKENAGWVRIEPENDELLNLIKESISEKNLPAGRQVVKAPHDMQPKEIFVIDISKTPEQLLTEMKPKTRYNIGVARKKGVSIATSDMSHGTKEKYTQEFLKLTKEMAQRQGIVAHPEKYYQKMIETLPGEMLKIYVAEFEGKIIAANLVLFFGETATYLHGASSNSHRNVMAPFLLQWQAILDAKEKGISKYDFGGIKSGDKRQVTSDKNDWSGITNFKLGFSPETEPVEFPGAYDIVVNPGKYALYRGLQRAKSFAYKFRK